MHEAYTALRNLNVLKHMHTHARMRAHTHTHAHTPARVLHSRDNEVQVLLQADAIFIKKLVIPETASAGAAQKRSIQVFAPKRFASRSLHSIIRALRGANSTAEDSRGCEDAPAPLTPPN